MGKRYLFLRLCDHLFIGIFAKHLNKATQRKGRDNIFGLPDCLAKYLRAKAQGKFQNPHAKKLGKNEMTEFVDKNEQTEDEDK